MRKSKTPQRTPHPDPGKELQLQRILDLRASIGRRVELIEQYRNTIRHLHNAMEETGYIQKMNVWRDEISTLDHRISEMETAIVNTGEDISKLQASIDPEDLAFL